MTRRISTTTLGGELAVRVGLLAGLVLVAGGAGVGEGGGALRASGDLRLVALELASGYATRVHDAVSMIMTLPLF